MAKKAYGIPNVADEVTNVPTAKECKPPKPTIFTPSELKEFLKAARDHDLYPLWHLVAMTGIRRSEALGLKWTDVDLDGSRIWIQRAVTVVRGSLKVGPVKTYRSERPVALDPKTVSVLRSHREAQGKVKTALGSAYSDQGLVFCRADGGHLVPNRVSDSMTELCRSAGLPHVTVHGLRHTHASILLDAKENPKVVQERLGHESAAFTLSRYTHVLPGRDGEAASRFARTVELAPDFDVDDDHVD